MTLSAGGRHFLCIFQICPYKHQHLEDWNVGKGSVMLTQTFWHQDSHSGLEGVAHPVEG